MTTDLKAGVFDYLSDELADLVGDRILPIRGSEGETLPYVTQQTISTVRTYTHDPFPLETGAWLEERIQFNCWSHEALEASRVGDALVAAVSGFSGPLGDLAIGRTDVVLELDDYQESTKLYRRIVDVVFAYEEGGSGS